MVAAKNNSFVEIEEIISSKEYQDLSEKIITNAGKILCIDIYDVEIDYCVSLVNASKILVEAIKSTIEVGDAGFVEFCMSYMAIEPALEQGQEYNEKDFPVEDEASNETYVGHSKTFLFQNAVYYIVLKNDQKNLVSFLSKIKKPHAAKFAKSLSNFFLNLKIQ